MDQQCASLVAGGALDNHNGFATFFLGGNLGGNLGGFEKNAHEGLENLGISTFGHLLLPSGSSFRPKCRRKQPSQTVFILVLGGNPGFSS